MVLACNLGFPRIGSRRELKKALEEYWDGRTTPADLQDTARAIRQQNWQYQQQVGVDHIPSNDFSFYDHVLDTIAMVGAVPKRFGWSGGNVDLDTYFLMARGASSAVYAKKNGKATAGTRPLEMTKWFNTNYHYIVPELEFAQKFALSSTKVLDEFLEAKELGLITRPVLLGPVSFLLLSKAHTSIVDRLALLDGLLLVYVQVLQSLAEAGAQWVQFDEPCLSTELSDQALKALTKTYTALSKSRGNLKLLVASYFDGLGKNLSVATALPIDALHVDLVNAPEEVDELLSKLPPTMMLSAGVIDGDNIWKCNVEKTIELLERILAKMGQERLMVSPSCSLLHLPIDVELEKNMDREIHSWLSFAKQKLQEIALVTSVLRGGKAGVAPAIEENRAICAQRAASPRVKDVLVRERVAAVQVNMFERISAYPERKKVQDKKFNLPLLPTTTIGSFPQTAKVRAARKLLRNGTIDSCAYGELMKEEILHDIELQEKIGIDVLVHGEPERNDMVQFFAEKLTGFVVTEHGWVQSYGSRYVKPSIIFGDISRPASMSVDWSVFAQEKANKPVKGMLTGPVTMLQWSFVRDDQHRSQTCEQLALAIREEVAELESNGIHIIQIDEPAIREGLPLKRSQWGDYLEWSVRCFRLSSSGVDDATQIHTHMCYSEFGDIIDAVAAMDADVISIEAARSHMDLLDNLRELGYPNEIGPGIYDIHSPLIPKEDDIEEQIRKALQVIPAERLWINPDCGLKTRRWEEVIPSLNAMVQAATKVRAELSKAKEHSQAKSV